MWKAAQVLVKSKTDSNKMTTSSETTLMTVTRKADLQFDNDGEFKIEKREGVYRSRNHIPDLSSQVFQICLKNL
jgi:hypothetical protein